MNKRNSMALLALMMGGGLDAFHMGADNYRQTGEVLPKVKRIKVCLLPGCERQCKGNYVYCSPEHLKEHKQLKRNE
jgi:hypothetical protein